MLKSTTVQSLIWPVCLVAHAAPIVVVAGFAPQLAAPTAAVTTVVLMFVLLAIERVLPYRADWSVRGDPEVWRDVGHAVAYAALAVNAARFIFLVVLAHAVSALGVADLWGSWAKGTPFALQVTLAIVLGDLLEYLYHRLCHSYPALWRLHAIHHTPVRLHTLKGARHHFLYAFGRGAFVWLPLLVLGVPPEAVYWQFIAETVTGLVGHANIRFRIPAFMHRLVVTPDFHRIHHSADPQRAHSNFGAVFPFWDLAFGTHSDPLILNSADVGMHADPIPREFLDELKSPVTYARLVKRLNDAGRGA